MAINSYNFDIGDAHCGVLCNGMECKSTFDSAKELLRNSRKARLVSGNHSCRETPYYLDT